MFGWWLNVNSMLSCRLTRRDGKSFNGECNDRAIGQSGKPLKMWINMAPPDTASNGNK